MNILIGKKLGMTQLFDTEGLAHGVTAIEVWPSRVVRLRTKEKDGYEAMQLGAGVKSQVGKAVAGQTGGQNGQGVAVLAEFPKVAPDVTVGQTFGIEQVQAGQLVDVTAVSKGKGFQGVVKRHNFSTGPKTHGSRNYREPGSIGNMGAARVFPGQKMPGRMGHQTVTTKNLQILAVHPDENVVLVGGAVPGPPDTVVTVIARREATAEPAQSAAPPQPSEPKAEKTEKPQKTEPEQSGAKQASPGKAKEKEA